MENKADKSNADKLVPVPVDVSKLNDLLKYDVIKKDICKAKIKNIEDKIHDITNLATKTTLNAKLNEVKNEILTVTNLVTSVSLNAKINGVKNEKSCITNLATTTALTAVQNKIPDHNKHITTPEFYKLTAENFTVRLKQAHLATKDDIADFVKKQISMIN